MLVCVCVCCVCYIVFVVCDFPCKVIRHSSLPPPPLCLKAPGGLELGADYWELVGGSPAGGAENLVNEESHIDVQLDQRHMMLRGDAVCGERRGHCTGWGGG